MCYYRSQRVREEYITEANYEFREANKGEIILGEHNVVPNYFEQFQVCVSSIAKQLR